MSLFVRRVLRASVAAGVATAAAHECSRLSKCESPRSTAPLRLPSIGLGLWKSAPGEVHNAVKEALLFGCRLLDGAAAYGNEKEVGGAIAASIAERVVRREAFGSSRSSSTRITFGTATRLGQPQRSTRRCATSASISSTCT